jgi:hypothetical protein
MSTTTTWCHGITPPNRTTSLTQWSFWTVTPNKKHYSLHPSAFLPQDIKFMITCVHVERCFYMGPKPTNYWTMYGKRSFWLKAVPGFYIGQLPSCFCHVGHSIPREHHHCEKHGNTQISPNLTHKLWKRLAPGMPGRSSQTKPGLPSGCQVNIMQRTVYNYSWTLISHDLSHGVPLVPIKPFFLKPWWTAESLINLDKLLNNF